MAGHAAQQRIAVLGASGLLGTAVTRELASRPVRLRLVSRRAAVVPRSCRADVQHCTVDLTRPGAVEEAVADADVVIHLVAHMSGDSNWRVAATDPVAERVNLGLVHDLVDAIRARRRKPPVVIFAGSMSQGGRSSASRIDGTELDQPLTAYDRHKLAAETALRAASLDGVLRGTTLRLATLYSGGDSSNIHDRGVVASMMRRAFAGQPLTMWHDGTVKRDLLCVDDAARAFVAAVDRIEAVADRHWLVGTGEATSIAELFTAIAEAASAHTGRRVPVVSVPPAEHSMPTDMLDFVLDPTRFRAATGWAPQVPLLDGLKRLAAATAPDSATSGAR